MAETKEEQAKRNWLEIQDRLAPGEDPIDRMLSDMAWAGTEGWHRVRNESGVALVLPDVPNYPQGSKEQRQLEDAWEQRSLTMHSAQTLILPDVKPAENPFGGKKIERGD